MEAYAWGLQRHSSSLISDNDHAYVALHLYSTTIVKLTFFQDLLGGPSIIDFTSTACTFPFSLATQRKPISSVDTKSVLLLILHINFCAK